MRRAGNAFKTQGRDTRGPAEVGRTTLGASGSTESEWPPKK
jgi:hypothetical protein